MESWPLVRAGRCFSVSSHTCPSLENPQPSSRLSAEQHAAQSLLLCLYLIRVHSHSLFALHGFLEVKAKAYPHSCCQAPSLGPMWGRLVINLSRTNQWLLVRNKRLPKCKIAFLRNKKLFLKQKSFFRASYNSAVVSRASLPVPLVGVMFLSCQVQLEF